MQNYQDQGGNQWQPNQPPPQAPPQGYPGGAPPQYPGQGYQRPAPTPQPVVYGPKSTRQKIGMATAIVAIVVAAGAIITALLMIGLGGERLDIYLQGWDDWGFYGAYDYFSWGVIMISLGPIVLAFATVCLAFAGKFLSSKCTNKKAITHVMWSSIVLLVFFIMSAALESVFLSWWWILIPAFIYDTIMVAAVIALAITFMAMKGEMFTPYPPGQNPYAQPVYAPPMQPQMAPPMQYPQAPPMVAAPYQGAPLMQYPQAAPSTGDDEFKRCVLKELAEIKAMCTKNNQK